MGTGSMSPIQAHTTPRRSSTGYAFVRTLPGMPEPGPSWMQARNWPVPSNVQPWYGQLSVPEPGKRTCPPDRLAPRCGQRSASACALPPSRQNTMSSPRSRRLTGHDPRSRERMTGYQ